MNIPAVAQRAASFVEPDNQFFIDNTPLFFKCEFPEWEKHDEVYYRGEWSQGKLEELARKRTTCTNGCKKLRPVADSDADSFLDKLFRSQSCSRFHDRLHKTRNREL